MEDFPFGIEKYLLGDIVLKKYKTCVDWVTDECYDYILSNQLYLGKEYIEIVISANIDCAQVEKNIEWIFNENRVKICIIYGEYFMRNDYFSVNFLGKVFRLPGWVLLERNDILNRTFSLIFTSFPRTFYGNYMVLRFPSLQSETVFQLMYLYFCCAIIATKKTKFFKGIYSTPLLLVCNMIFKLTKKEEKENEYTRFINDILGSKEELPLGKKSFKTLYRYIFWLYRNFYR